MKTLKSTQLVLAIFTLLGIGACNYNSPTPTENSNFQNVDTTQTPSYKQVFNAVIAPKCLPCHLSPNGRAGINLDNYPDFIKNKNFVANSIGAGRMPPGGPLPKAEKDYVLGWINAGAPENGSSTPPTVTPSISPSPSPSPASSETENKDCDDDFVDDSCPK